jgi:hypothetical protein
MVLSRDVMLASRILGVALAVGFLGANPCLRAELPPLIPRDVLFGNPERTSPRLSPDGQRLAWLAPNTNNVLQIWVRTVGKQDDRVVTADKRRGIRVYNWARNSEMLLYLQDTDGDENFQVHGVDLANGNVRNFTAIQECVEILWPRIATTRMKSS